MSTSELNKIVGEVVAADIGINEGERCNRDCCQGVMKFVPNGNCSCHISPPCNACEEAHLLCNACDADPEDEMAGK